MLKVPQHFNCPTCKSPLKKVNASETTQGRMKFGALVCESCDRPVGQVSFGKLDFLRVSDAIVSQSESAPHICEDFTYKRVPWHDASIRSSGMSRYDLGWTPEGFAGVLFADDKTDWEIIIETNATDLGIRCLSHSWSGAIYVTVNGQDEKYIDLYDEHKGDIKRYPIFQDLSGSKTVKIRPADTHKSPHGNQVFFSGYDACFNQKQGADSLARSEVNRGNSFPPMYEWVLPKLAEDAFVLDCGSGDRCFKDSRFVGFEYMSFELPDAFGDGHALPFANDVFDVVFSQAVMEHMRDPYLAAREIARVLKPGGLVYVESAFMQPLHAVPYHFFNTTPWGIEELFTDAGLTAEMTEWFGALSGSVQWYLDCCGGGQLSKLERNLLMRILRKVDRQTNYESLKPIASAVAFWGIKPGETHAKWKAALQGSDRPTFKY
ncbi:class I SAM-dependent methyltransferase [Phormidesmis sp. 146-35]